MASVDRKTLIAAAAAALVAAGLGVWFFSRSTKEEETVDAAVLSLPVKKGGDASKEAGEVGTRRRSYADVAASGAAASTAPVAGAVVTSAPSTKDEEGELKLTRQNLVDLMRAMVRELEAFKEEMEPKAEMYMTDEESFMTYQKEVADGLKAIEEKVQSKFGVDQMDLLRAQNAYRDDPEVQEEMKRVRSVFFGEGDMPSADEVEVPADMTADKFFELFCKHVETVDGAFEAAFKEAKASAPKGERNAYMQLLMQRRFPEINARAQEAVGMSDSEFQSCLFKWQSDPRLVAKLMESQEKQMVLRMSLESDD